MKINAMSQARLIKLMLEGTYSCAELAAETGLHYVTVLHYTRELHRVGAAHISMWDADTRGRALVKIYKIGAAKDAKRKPMTALERQRRYREKMRNARLLQMIAGKP
jgi:hypothetical protein